MPCRPKLCQRLAAQLSHPPPTPFGSNHIWISDEVLSEAFNRFVRVSHTSRRHGSNVPGPLEARKRSAKRRMGCAVAAANMGPPGGDFGALFGAGAGAGGNAVEKGWSWTAPGSRPVPTQKALDVWGWGARTPKQPAEWEQPLAIPQTVEELVEESRVAFDDLLKDAGSIDVLGRSDMAILSEFLMSSADEPAAKNVRRLIQWLPGRSISASAWEAIIALICDKIKLVSIDNEELSDVIRGLPHALDWKQDDSDRRRLHDMYAAITGCLDDRALSDSLVHQTVFEEVHRTTQNAQACTGLLLMLAKTIGDVASVGIISEQVSLTLLAIHSHGGEDLSRNRLLSQLASMLRHISPTAIPRILKISTRKVLDNGSPSFAYIRPRALTWLHCLTQAASLDKYMPVVYAELANRLRPYQLTEHFASDHIEPYDIARAILHDWLPHTDLKNATDIYAESVSASTTLKQLKTLKGNLRDISTADLSVVAQEFERLRAQAKQDKAWDLTWKILLQAFVRTGVAYGLVVSDVISICKARYSPDMLYHIYIDMLSCPGLALPNRITSVLVHHFMSKGENLLALKTFRADPSLGITEVPTLPLTLLEDFTLKFHMFSMFLRHADSVPTMWRKLLKCKVNPELIDLVHVVAHGVARTTTINDSQAYRRVWSLYRWLQDRGAPVEPLISRALVTAGILRPIRKHVWIPDERLEYILSIVEKVEGVEIREQVEGLALRMREEVHDKVLLRRRAKEENAWTLESTEMAKKAQFRLKQWSKRKPLRREDGRSYYVPDEGGYDVWRPARDEGVVYDDETKVLWSPVGVAPEVEDAYRLSVATKAALPSTESAVEPEDAFSRLAAATADLPSTMPAPGPVDAFSNPVAEEAVVPPTDTWVPAGSRSGPEETTSSPVAGKAAWLPTVGATEREDASSSWLPAKAKSPPTAQAINPEINVRRVNTTKPNVNRLVWSSPRDSGKWPDDEDSV